MATSAVAPRVGSATTWMVVLLGLMIFINYVDRGNLATAGPLIKSEMGLTNTTFGLLVSAFFWTYTPAQLAAGWMAERFNTYLVLAGGLVIWALATALTGLATGFASLLILRLVLGIGESVAFPCSSKLIAEHVPPERYGWANSMPALGLSIGPAAGIYVGGLVMAAVGWRASFVAFGLASLLWLIPWLMVSRDAAPAHRSTEPCPSLRAITARSEAWAAALGHFCINYTFYLVLAWLPLYLVKVHGYTLPQMAAIGGTIYLVNAASAAFFGWLPDAWMARGASTTRARKTMMVGGMTVTSLCMVAAALGSGTVALSALFVSAAFSGMHASNLYACGQILAGPSAAGKWIGFQNFVGNIAGTVAPLLTGWLIDLTGGYGLAFGIAACVALAGALCWGVLLRQIAPVAWK